MRPEDIIDQFHVLYYAQGGRGGTWTSTRWLGTPVLKCPLDLWIYQELLHELRPDLIVECGTASGGSALYLASICELLSHGRVITIDVVRDDSRPAHPRLEHVHGSSIAPEVVARVRAAAADAERVLVILDSDHSAEHVGRELEAYAPLVTPGSYVIVEDTNLDGNPVLPGWGPGPRAAVEAFLRRHREFEVDRTREKLLLTFNPGGFLRRTRHE
jgi:cephalosporin hydroxylase